MKNFLKDEINAVIFDFDGVLIDSYNDHADAFLIAGKKFGLNFDKNKIFKSFGISAKEIVKSFYPNLKESFLEKFVREKKKIYRKIVRERGIRLNHGAKDILRFLKKKNLKIAISSSASKKNILLALEKNKIRNFFDAIIAAEDTKKHKPNPDPLLKTAKKIKVDPKTCFYIGDSIYEMIAAKRAKMKAIGLLTGIYKRKDLEKYKPVFLANNLKEIKNFFKKFL